MTEKRPYHAFTRARDFVAQIGGLALSKPLLGPAMHSLYSHAAEKGLQAYQAGSESALSLARHANILFDIQKTFNESLLSTEFFNQPVVNTLQLVMATTMLLSNLTKYTSPDRTVGDIYQKTGIEALKMVLVVSSPVLMAELPKFIDSISNNLDPITSILGIIGAVGGAGLFLQAGGSIVGRYQESNSNHEENAKKLRESHIKANSNSTKTPPTIPGISNQSTIQKLIRTAKYFAVSKAQLRNTVKEENLLQRQESEKGVQNFLRDDLDLPTGFQERGAHKQLNTFINFAIDENQLLYLRVMAQLEADTLANQIKKYQQYH